MDKDHSLRENLLALTLGSALVSLGVIFFNQVGLLTGGTAGLAIFLTKVTDFSFGQVFFCVEPTVLSTFCHAHGMALYHQYFYRRDNCLVRRRPFASRHSNCAH